MKAGDLVRFRHARPPGSRYWEVGLLIEYNTWEKIARILYKGEILAVHASNVEKAGKKDALVGKPIMFHAK